MVVHGKQAALTSSARIGVSRLSSGTTLCSPDPVSIVQCNIPVDIHCAMHNKVWVDAQLGPLIQGCSTPLLGEPP
jgi:hypothetical protein